MRRRAIGILAAVLAALAVAGCGSSEEEIPPNEADTLLGELQILQEQIDAGDCDAADGTISDLFITARALPKSDVKSGTIDLLDNLEALVVSECTEAEEPTTTTTDSTTTSTTTEPTTTDTTDTTTTTTTTTPTTTTQPTTTTTEPPTTPGGSGGTPPGRGGN